MTFEIEEKYDGVTSVKWTTHLDLLTGEGKKTFQLNRCYPHVLNFDVSFTCSNIDSTDGHLNPRTDGHIRHRGFCVSLQKLKIEVSLTQVDCGKQRPGSSGELDLLPDYYRRPCAVEFALNRGEKLILKKSPGLDEWRSETFQFYLPGDHRLESELLIKFNMFGAKEMNALKQMTDYLFVQQTNCDVQFCFGDGQRIGGHTIILSARSKVFAVMFNQDMRETKTGQVVIEDIEPEIFKELLHFIYSGRLRAPLMEETAQTLCDAAEKYDIQDLKRECIPFLVLNVSLTNAINLMAWADLRSIDDLKEAALGVVVRDFKRICQTKEWENFVNNFPHLSLQATQRAIQ
ncbi:hypothetical protein GHT06_010244 [Daphnia sinensis]|uniref:BTB domain-containing protein n=1 Tax=Daphnia sinensis TaxID=1820382 RepID=A0AAD5KXV5_9CRUS|nr:hypothetical protein GHT06_010244 [Daphnia sinensis]